MNSRYMFKKWKWLFLLIFLVLLDIIVKYYIRIYVSPGQILYILPGINCCCVQNSGLALGLFSDLNVCYRWLLMCLIMSTLMILIIFLYKSIKYYVTYNIISFSMIISGAIGNVCDRICYGTVLDFIDLYIGEWHWPTFNIADIEICMGMLMLIIKRDLWINR